MANVVKMKGRKNRVIPVLAVLLFVSPWDVGHSAVLSTEPQSGASLTLPEPARPVDCSIILGTEHPAAIYCDD